MSQKEEHLAQAAHNAQFFNQIDKAAFSDWAATVLFYAALQFIDAFLALHNIHPSSHDRRDEYLTKLQELRPISHHYFRLKSASRNARYYPQTKFTPEQLDELENQHLAPISAHLLPLLT